MLWYSKNLLTKCYFTLIRPIHFSNCTKFLLIRNGWLVSFVCFMYTYVCYILLEIFVDFEWIICPTIGLVLDLYDSQELLLHPSSASLLFCSCTTLTSYASVETLPVVASPIVSYWVKKVNFFWWEQSQRFHYDESD